MNPKALFISHGGGPLPLLGDVGHSEMVACLQQIAANIPKPDAIVLVSAHWEAPSVTITSANEPPLIYDYYGFAEAAYEIQYPCSGLPRLAEDLYKRFIAANLNPLQDQQRGFDHGLFVPLKIMYPNADIPCVQVSLESNLDPATHIEIGRAMQGLHEQNVLVIGSGFSFHNMAAFFSDRSLQAQQANYDFEDWLAETCTATSLTESSRHQQLINWAAAPGARFCHPREEHLLPLHVCYGVAETAAAERFELTVLNRKTSMFVW